MAEPLQSAAWVALAVGLTVLLPVAGSLSSASPVPLRLALSPASDYASFGGSNAQILFGSPLPEVEIQSTANASYAATLGLPYLLELAPDLANPAHPSLVAVAEPETLQHFNGTPASSYLSLVATLPVFPAAGILWSNGTDVAAAGEEYQQAILDVNYSLATGAGGAPGVQVSWSVSGWPWAATSGDQLALEFIVNVASGDGFKTCTGAATGAAPASACAAGSLHVGEPVWGSALSALRASGPAGLVAWVSWSPDVGGTVGPATPVTAGAYVESPSTSALVVESLTDEASAVSGSTLFLLAPAAVPHPLGPLVGDLPVYGGALAVSAAVVGVGLFAARRRDQAISRELTE